MTPSAIGPFSPLTFLPLVPPGQLCRQPGQVGQAGCLEATQLFWGASKIFAHFRRLAALGADFHRLTLRPESDGDKKKRTGSLKFPNFFCPKSKF